MKFRVNNCKALPIWYGTTEYTTKNVSAGIQYYPKRNTFYVFNGTHWVWISHGLESDTIYNALSVAEGIAGTATYLRSIRADYLKQIINYYVDAKMSLLTIAEYNALATKDPNVLYLTY